MQYMAQIYNKQKYKINILKGKYNKYIESENDKDKISTLLNTINKYYQHVAFVKTLINIFFHTLAVLIFIILKLYLRLLIISKRIILGHTSQQILV